ncbi:hypothetical protein ONZ45_g6379 [Pleurotus djamor]|nr:hypothetical protein ONZ45_g6379 [Pleurotus djamor]
MDISHLPSEVFHQILNFIGEQPVLYSLSLTSLAFHAEVTPLLFSRARFIESEQQALLERLTAFLRTLDKQPYLRSYVRELVIELHGDLFTESMVVPLKHILVYLRCLDAFIFDCPLAKPNIILPIFSFDLDHSTSDQTHPMVLKKLVFDHVIYTFDAFIRFLCSQPRLEHLEIPMLFVSIDVPPGLFPHLKILDTTLASSVRFLLGNRVSHFRVMMSPMHPELLDVEGMRESLEAVKVLAVRNATFEKMFSLASYMPNLEYLQLETWGFSRGYSDADVLECASRCKECNGTIRHIRFVRRFGVYDRQSPVIPTLFDRIPSLQCLDFEAGPDAVYDRWYRGRLAPLRVKWSCEPREAWRRDWEDYTVVAA